MNEKFRLSGNINLTITDDDASKTPAMRPIYYAERHALKESGAPTWMVRRFDSPTEMEGGLIYDYYVNGGLIGFIDGSDQDGYHVYGPEIEEDAGPHHLNGETVELRSEAQRMLQEYIAETYLAHPDQGQ